MARNTTLSYNDQMDPSLQPRTNPVDRFAHLPEHTRTFLEGLSKEEVKALTDILASYRRAATIGWFFKWLIVSMVGAFMAAVAFGEALAKFLSWVSSAFKGV